MKKAKICASIINNDLAAIKEIEPLVDLFEVRIDLVGDGWQEIGRQLDKPWIACNRLPDEGGQWQGKEQLRIEQLAKSIELGASIIDLELATENLGEALAMLKNEARCILSYHDLQGTPPLENLQEKVNQQLQAGADICKVVTTANRFADNLITLQLISSFPDTEIVAFAMGEAGYLSRVLCPLVGGEFTYAAIQQGKEAAPGQIAVNDLVNIYQVVQR